MTAPALYTVKQAAPKHGKSVSWMYHNIRDLHRTVIGGETFFTEEQIARNIAERAVAPKSPKKKTPAEADTAPAKTKTKTKNTKRIPQADFSISRLYRDGAAQ